MSTGWPLSQALQQKAETCFQSDFSQVRIHIDSTPLCFGASAYAYGTSIHLSPHVLQVPESQLLELIGHELMHIVQQRQGRVKPMSCEQGCWTNDSVLLEQEAQEAGRHFALGHCVPVSSRKPSLGCSPVIQKAVMVGSELLANTASLSQATSLVLDLIPMGWDWLDWAISNPTLTISLDNEIDLLRIVQGGLHGSELLLLKNIGLLVDPARLVDLEQNDLKALVNAEENTQETPKLNSVLLENHFLLQSDFSRVTAYLQALGIQEHPVFLGMSFTDQIELFHWRNGQEARWDRFGKEAANFALQYAQTPSAFIDYYQFFLALASRTENWKDSKRIRERAAQKLLNGFTESLPLLLRSPQIGMDPEISQVFSTVQNWVNGGNYLGFRSASAALLQVTQNTDLSEPHEIQQVLNNYMFQAGELLRTTEPTANPLSQDGKTRTYTVKSNEAFAELFLNTDGILTLQTFYTNAMAKQVKAYDEQFLQSLENTKK